MKPSLDCLPCFVNQALVAARRGTDDATVQEAIVKAVLRKLTTFDLNRPSPEMGAFIDRTVATTIGREDLYLSEKQRFNALMKSHLPAIRKMVETAPDPFETAARAAIAGNLIDFTAPGGKTDSSFESVFTDLLHRPMSRVGGADAVRRLKSAAKAARRILYLADNAGEIVVDRLLVEQLPMQKVTMVVRGGPVANDALMEDAEFAGLHELVEVIDSGLRIPGTIVSDAPKSFQKIFKEADLVISKGQGNFETIEFEPDRIFFLFVIKCRAVADQIGAAMGEMIITDRPGSV